MKDRHIWLPVYFPVFWEGIDVDKGDYIKGKVTRTLSENGLSPDFRLDGCLYRNGKEPQKFEYVSNHIITDFRSNGFYDKIFSGEELKIAEEIDPADLLDYLKDKLPAYMIPSQFVPIEKFPVTVNGKIDDRKLLEIESSQNTGRIYIAPDTGTEKQLVSIWQDLLKINQIGVTDNFFELGGHSLLAMRLVSAIRKNFGIELQINEVFEYPTVSLLATRLVKRPMDGLLPAVTAEEPRPEHIPLSFSQERLWFIDRLEGRVYNTHIPAVLRLKGALDQEALQTHASGRDHHRQLPWVACGR